MSNARFFRRKKPANRENLLKYCEKNDIFVPPKCSVEYLLSAIYRKLMDGKTPEITADSCFGYWEDENMTCSSCDFEDRCFKLAMGVDRESYEKSIKNQSKHLK